MINIRTLTRTYESEVFSHPGSSGSSYVDYNIAHNFGAHPSIVAAYSKGSSGSDLQWKQLADMRSIYPINSNTYGYEVKVSTDTSYNELDIRVYRVAGTTSSLKFRVFL